MCQRIYFRYIHHVLGKSWYMLSVGVTEKCNNLGTIKCCVFFIKGRNKCYDS